MILSCCLYIQLKNDDDDDWQLPAARIYDSSYLNDFDTEPQFSDSLTTISRRASVTPIIMTSTTPRTSFRSSLQQPFELEMIPTITTAATITTTPSLDDNNSMIYRTSDTCPIHSIPKRRIRFSNNNSNGIHYYESNNGTENFYPQDVRL